MRDPFVLSVLLHTGLVTGFAGRLLPSPPATHESPPTEIELARAAERTKEVDIEIVAPRPAEASWRGTLAGSNQSGTASAPGRYLAKAGAEGDERTGANDAPRDAAFGMVALVESSRTVDALGADDTWSRRSGGGAAGLYAVDEGDAFGHGLALSGVGISGRGEGQGIGLGAVGTLGYVGNTSGRTHDPWRYPAGAWQHYGYAHWHSRPAMIHHGVPTVSGPLSAGGIKRVVVGDDSALLVCYWAALRTHAGLGGTVRVDLLIDGDGRVLAVKDSGSIDDATLLQCFATSFASLRFPEAEHRTRVGYPLSLSPPHVQGFP